MSWTLDLFKVYGRSMDLRSVWALRRMLLDEGSGRIARGDTVTVHVRTPRARVALRAFTNDLFTFREVFVARAYRVARDAKVATTIVDIGANAGFASVYLLGLFPEARLLAVEPDPRNIQILTRNLQAHGARVLQAALWHSVGAVHFALPPQADDVVSGTVEDGHSDRSVSVDGLTMDAMLDASGFETVDIVKIDVEGAERHLFAHGAAWLSRVRCLLVEFHHDARTASGFDDVMREHGFDVHDDGHTVMALARG